MALPITAYNAQEPVPCSACGSPHEALVFPAFLGRARAAEAEQVADDTEASCFYHPAKKAAVTCENCGRFVCGLCEVELDGRHLCPQCLDSGKRKGKIASLETSRTLYDNIALALAAYPMLFLFTIYFTFITAPVSMFILFRYRKLPRSLVRPGRWRWWLALVIALLQIGLWVFGIAALFSIRRKHGH